MNNVYGSDTAGLIQEFRSIPAKKALEMLNNMIVRERPKQKVIFEESEEGQRLCIERPSDKARANVILLAPLEEGLKKGVLAKEYLNICPQQFSMIISKKGRHKVDLDLIVSAALVIQKPFSTGAINHVLMEVGRSGLFTDTYLRETNLRNGVLSKIIEYAQDHECPRERWILFAREVLAFLGMEPLRCLPPDRLQLSRAEKDLAYAWLEELEESCYARNYMTKRWNYFQRFADAAGLSTSAAVKEFAEKIGYDDSVVRATFARETIGKGSHGERGTILKCAIGLGCTIDEANEMLREANYALLYPLREDPVERFDIISLLENEFKRGMA